MSIILKKMIKLVALFLSLSALSANGANAVSRKLGGRIVGGESADENQFPFAAAVSKYTNAGSYLGVGTLINDQWILTSAGNVIGAILFIIRLGANSLVSTDPNAQQLTTEIFFMHPEYNTTTLDNNIALIKLRSPITLTDSIKPVSFVSDINLPDYSSVVTYGWGLIGDSISGSTNPLQYVYLVTLTNEECRQVFGNQITDNMVCVAGNSKQGICRGDIGSPLIQYDSNSQPYVVGVSNFISSNGCESTDPSEFTRVNLYVDWINNITANN